MRERPLKQRKNHPIDIEQRGQKSTSLIGDQPQVFQVEGNLYYQPGTPVQAIQTTIPLLPAPVPGMFVGREDALKDMERFFRQDTEKVFVIEGIGGIGKTSLAAYASQAFRQEFQDIYWGIGSVKTTFRRLYEE